MTTCTGAMETARGVLVVAKAAITDVRVALSTEAGQLCRTKAKGRKCHFFKNRFFMSSDAPLQAASNSGTFR